MPHFDEPTHAGLTFGLSYDKLTPGHLIKPGCLARQPLCHKVTLPSSVARQTSCHKVNLSRYEARWRHFIMTCDIYSTEINKLNENTEKVNEVKLRV